MHKGAESTEAKKMVLGYDITEKYANQSTTDCEHCTLTQYITEQRRHHHIFELNAIDWFLWSKMQEDSYRP